MIYYGYRNVLHWAAEPLLSLICYYPDSAVGKGSVPDLGFRLVSSAPAAVETIVVDVGGGQSAPQGPSKNSQRIAAGKGRSHCCCPEGELGSVNFSSDQCRTPVMSHGGPPIPTASTPVKV